MMQHLVVAPIVLPLIVSALLLLLDSRHIAIKRIISLAAASALVLIAIALLWQINDPLLAADAAPYVYRPGNWPAPFGIVLVADRLSLLMVLLTGVLGLAALIYATARWDRVDPRFHSLFLFLLTGVNGAFLTGDIFNLFVFFELLLAASYGLALHGGGELRLRVGLHYITINIAASLLLLVGIALLYGVTGSLNLAEIAVRIPAIASTDLVLFEAGMASLGIAFLVKSGIWPLGFWLSRTYAAAVPPVAAVFAILTKVGVYIILRLDSLFFGDAALPSGGFANNWLVWAGCITIAFGMLSILSTRRLSRVAGHYLMVSSGTLLAGIGIGGPALVAALLFYLVSATLAVGAFYLLTELVRRNRFGDEESDLTEPVFADEDIAAIVEKEDETGIVIPGTIALLGVGFIFCTLLLSGLPPLSGFIAKFAIIDALLGGATITTSAWVLITLIILAGLATLVALTRAGIDLLWTPEETVLMTRLRLAEVAPIALLLALCATLMVFAGPAYVYLEGAAAALAERTPYVEAVLGAGTLAMAP